MKPANFASVYCALYPELSEVAREHGYALAIHGSMARDFDLICIPWVKYPSAPKQVVDAITSRFAITQRGDMDAAEHGRERWPLSISFGECYIDLSFMPMLRA